MAESYWIEAGRSWIQPQGKASTSSEYKEDMIMNAIQLMAETEELNGMKRQSLLGSKSMFEKDIMSNSLVRNEGIVLYPDASCIYWSLDKFISLNLLTLYSHML